MNILLKPDSSLPIYEQLVQAFKESMLNGELSPGDMLPTLRPFGAQNVLKKLFDKAGEFYQRIFALYPPVIKEMHKLIFTGKGFFVKQVDFRTLQEEQLVQLEHALSSCIEDAKKLSLSLDEVQDLIQLLWKGRD